MSYYDYFYKFVKRIQDHLGTGPYRIIEEHELTNYVEDFKRDLDKWLKETLENRK